MTNPLLKQALRSLRHGDLHGALDQAEQGLSSTDEASDDYWKFVFAKAESLRLQGQPQAALALLNSLVSDKSPSPNVRALLEMHKAYLSSLQGLYGDAKRHFDKAEEIASKDHLESVLIEVNLRKAMFLFQTNDFNASENLYRLILRSSLEQKDSYSEAIALAGIGKNAMIRGEYEQAIGWYEKSLALAEKLGTRLHMSAMWSELGWCYYKLKNDDRALELFRQAESLLRDAGATQNYQICLGNIGNVYCRRGDYPSAISYYQRALELAREINDPVSAGKWLSNLAMVFSKMGNPVVAGTFDKQARQVQDQLEEMRTRTRTSQVNS